MEKFDIGVILFAAFIGLIFGFVLSASCFVWIVPLFVLILGKSKCIPPKSIEPVYVMVLAAVLASTGAAAAASTNVFIAPAAGLLGVFLASFIAAIYLRIAGGRKGKHEFVMKRKYAYTAKKPETRLKPVKLLDDSEFHRIFATSGFYLYSITLFDTEGMARTNKYVNWDKFERDKERLIEKAGCIALDLVIACEEKEEILHSVKLDNEWAEILFSPMDELPDEKRAWWKQWLRPVFSPESPVEIDAHSILLNVGAFEKAYHLMLEDKSGVKSNIDGIKYMTGIAGSPMLLMTRELFNDYRKEFSKGKELETIYENDVSVLRPEKKDQ